MALNTYQTKLELKLKYLDLPGFFGSDVDPDQEPQNLMNTDPSPGH